MNKLLIYNNYPAHFEIIESVIVNYQTFFTHKIEDVIIYLACHYNESFINYIKNKYTNIILINLNNINLNNYTYVINCTIYEQQLNKTIFNIDSKIKYISHRITDKMQTNDNIFYLSPLSKKNVFIANVLPFSEHKVNSNKPIFIVQGNLVEARRNYNLLVKILEKEYEYDFEIRLVGRGNLPNILRKYKDKIVVKNNLNFVDYHKEFQDAYCILPLITKNSHPQYYTNTLTSSINYIIGYNTKCIIDKDLQDIYKLQNAEIFNDINDITSAFERSLRSFYVTN